MLSKAGLPEIFAAVNGVCGEGVNLCKKGVGTKSHPLTEIAYVGATKLFDAQYRVMTRPDQEAAARPLIEFLKSSLPTLDQYAALGQTAAVRDHVRDILGREESGGIRSLERFKEGGVPARAFKAPYTGKQSEKFVPGRAIA